MTQEATPTIEAPEQILSPEPQAPTRTKPETRSPAPSIWTREKVLLFWLIVAVGVAAIWIIADRVLGR